MLRACAASFDEQTRSMGLRLSELSGVNPPRVVQEPSFMPDPERTTPLLGPLRG
jgi:hypothetical protein